MENKKQEPLFGQYAGATLERCIAVFKERGSQYSDTMRECNFLLMRAIAKELGLNIPDKFMRILCIAAFADMKYSRFLGGYKEDTAEDAINYIGFVAEEMRQIKAGTQEPSACDYEPKPPVDVKIKVEAPDFGSHPSGKRGHWDGQELWFRHHASDGHYYTMHSEKPSHPSPGELIHVKVINAEMFR